VQAGRSWLPSQRRLHPRLARSLALAPCGLFHRLLPVLRRDVRLGREDVLAKVLPAYVLAVPPRILIAHAVVCRDLIEQLLVKVVSVEAVLECGAEFPARAWAMFASQIRGQWRSYGTFALRQFVRCIRRTLSSLRRDGFLHTLQRLRGSQCFRSRIWPAGRQVCPIDLVAGRVPDRCYHPPRASRRGLR
jgi:hypothetical protein